MRVVIIILVLITGSFTVSPALMSGVPWESSALASNRIQFNSSACRAGYQCRSFREVGCVPRGKINPLVRSHTSGQCTHYAFSISFVAAYNAKHVRIDSRRLQCPVWAIDKKTYSTSSTCHVAENGGSVGFAIVATVLKIINHNTKWMFSIIIYINVDTHGKVTKVFVVPPTRCPDTECS